MNNSLQPISEYVENRHYVQSLGWRYNPITGTGSYLWNGSLVSDEFIEELYPVAERPMLFNHISKGDNPNGKLI